MNIVPFLFDSLSKHEKSLLPSAAEVENYLRVGWYQSPKILSDKEIEAALQSAQQFYQGKIDFPLPNRKGIADDEVDHKKAIRNNEMVTLQMKGLQNLGFHKLIVSTALMLSQAEGIRFFADSLINKKPVKSTHKGIVGWHTDKAYWPTCTSDKMLTAWIPLQDITLDMGPLIHIDRSHTWNDNQALKSNYSFNNQDLSGLYKFLEVNNIPYNESLMIIKKGQVCFHNCHTIHASGINTSEVNRVALAVHFQDTANQYQKAYKADGSLISIGYDELCSKDEKGNPNYADPTVFPELCRR